MGNRRQLRPERSLRRWQRLLELVRRYVYSQLRRGPTAENHLHANPYPNTAAPGQTKECEAGNEDYLVGKTLIGNVPGNQGTTTQGQVK